MNGQRDMHMERTQKKLTEAFRDRNYYEAHQLYRTFNFRMLKQQKFQSLSDLLFSGACQLLDHAQVSSGTDVAMLFAEVLSKGKLSVDSFNLQRVQDIFERLSPSLHVDTSDADVDYSSTHQRSLEERQRFISLVLDWAKSVEPTFPKGHPDVHRRLAMSLWRNELDYSQARYHFLLTSDGKDCAAFLVDFHLRRGYSYEVDLFIAQFVLQMLCFHNKHAASETFDAYTEQHPAISHHPPFARPLLNFLWLLFLSIDSGKVVQFTVLVEKYQYSLRRDPCYRQYLDLIGQHYFGLPPPKKAKSSMLGGMFGNLFQGLFEPDTTVQAPATGTHRSGPNERASTTGASAGSSGSASLTTTKSIEVDDDLD